MAQITVGKWQFHIGASKKVKGGALPMSGIAQNTSLGAGFGTPYSRLLLPSTKVDYVGIAGDMWKNPVVAIALDWIGRNLPQAPSCLMRRDLKGNEKPDYDHPVVDLLQRPNPYYDGKTLKQATFLSLIAGRGNAYWYLVKSNDGLPKELWYLPHFAVFPYWRQEATTENWIQGYKYRQRGRYIDLKYEDVIHFRNGLDPYEMRMGLDPTAPLAKEIVTDNEASGYQAAILRNMGIASILISPKDGKAVFDETEQEALQAQWEEMTTGDARGKPLVLSGGVEVSTLSQNAQEMLLTEAQDRGEARISAITGINIVALGLLSGLAASTFTNKIEARTEAWEDGICPRLELINAELDSQLLGLYFDGIVPKGVRVGCDYRQVKALQDNQDALAKRLLLLVGGPILTPNESREKLGFDPIAGGDELYPPPTQQPDPAAQDGGKPGGDGANPPAKKPKKSETYSDEEKREFALSARNGHSAI